MSSYLKVFTKNCRFYAWTWYQNTFLGKILKAAEAYPKLGSAGDLKQYFYHSLTLLVLLWICSQRKLGLGMGLIKAGKT
tara:strand:- start:233 stop:469 length:237 start_codon:yes stop_codon:yes gene_type:complete